MEFRVTEHFEYLIIPRNAGTFTIPSVEFAYFNTNKEQYINLKTEEVCNKCGERKPIGRLLFIQWS